MHDERALEKFRPPATRRKESANTSLLRVGRRGDVPKEPSFLDAGRSGKTIWNSRCPQRGFAFRDKGGALYRPTGDESSFEKCLLLLHLSSNAVASLNHIESARGLVIGHTLRLC